MKITVKTYYCPACGNEEQHSTNHYGEIYCHCKKCGNGVLYCKEVEQPKPDGKCQINFYRFNIEDKTEADQYKNLKKQLTAKGYKVFDTFTTHSAFEAIRQHDGKNIDLFKVKQFDNQIVSSIGRVFYWFEAIWPNKKIKSGYYLENIEEV